jgi:delta8-fatty-acid desaturase
MTLQLPTWQMRAAWVVLSHASDFILYLQTVITHFPREISPGVKTEWIESQAVGTLNWFSPPELDWYHGGLQWQIEHHLFPGISQYYYPALAPLVVSTCQEFGIPYRYERNFFTAFSAHLTYLKEMGAKGRPHKMD